jgi:methylmalonyl-CoA mutase
VFRPAAPFERLRERSDAVLASTGARPRAFLATLGPLVAHGTRAGFARNLLHAGGIDTVDAGPTASVDEVTAAFTAAGTPVAVLCSTDALYAERAAATVGGLRAAGARLVFAAGGAGTTGAAGASDVPGLDGHLRAGGDALAVLDAVWSCLDGEGPPPTRTTVDAADAADAAEGALR